MTTWYPIFFEWQIKYFGMAFSVPFFLGQQRGPKFLDGHVFVFLCSVAHSPMGPGPDDTGPQLFLESGRRVWHLDEGRMAEQPSSESIRCIMRRNYVVKKPHNPWWAGSKLSMELISSCLDSTWAARHMGRQRLLQTQRGINRWAENESVAPMKMIVNLCDCILPWTIVKNQCLK